MAQSPRFGFDPAGEGGLGHALAQQTGDAGEDLVGERRGGGDALDLPSRLDGPLAPRAAAPTSTKRAPGS